MDSNTRSTMLPPDPIRTPTPSSSSHNDASTTATIDSLTNQIADLRQENTVLRAKARYYVSMCEDYSWLHEQVTNAVNRQSPGRDTPEILRLFNERLRQRIEKGDEGNIMLELFAASGTADVGSSQMVNGMGRGVNGR